MSCKIYFILLAIVFFTGAHGLAESKTQTQIRIDSYKQILSLHKITVGPEDQYNGAVNHDQTFLVYSHKANLVPHLRILRLSDGKEEDLLPLDADSQEASFADDGRIAFTYFKSSARGDICWSSSALHGLVTLRDADFHCLPRSTNDESVERSSPFWFSASELGYVERSIESEDRKIIVQNIRSHARRVILQGDIWAPSMKANGRYIVYDELIRNSEGQRKTIGIFDLVNNLRVNLNFDLPGFPGFPYISRDEKFIYFSHYLDDTNGDNAIDGSDNAVVFRLPVDKALQIKGRVMPEQLTSVESSCSYPHVIADNLYLTCAFQGSLDIYKIPTTGVVPSTFDLNTLREALTTSRSYQDRILLLNALAYRYPGTVADLPNVLLNNHILAGDQASALYYIPNAFPLANDKTLRELLATQLNLELLEKNQKDQEPSPAFKRELNNKLEAVERIKKTKLTAEELMLAHCIEAGIHFALGDQVRLIKSLSALKEIGLQRVTLRPLIRSLWFKTLDTDLPPGEDRERYFVHMINAPDMGEQSQIFYAFEYLRRLQFIKNLDQRKQKIKAVAKDLHAGPSQLFASEILALDLAQASTPAEKAKRYNLLDQMIASVRGDYYLRRAVNVRAIINLAAAADFDNLSAVASNWLRYTQFNETEFIYARDVFTNASYAQAYAAWGAKNFQYASSYFYGAVALTDDPEAHFGFISADLAIDQRAAIDRTYFNLKKSDFIKNNIHYVNALLILADQPQSSSMNAVIEETERMTGDHPLKHLLLGECYLQELLLSIRGVEFKQDLLEKSHRHLMLAYDLSRDNMRIAASSLSDLGILHRSVRNFALATRFFSLRQNLGFDNKAEQDSLLWLLADSYFHTHQDVLAADQMQKMQLQSPEVIERHAFYLMSANRFAESAKVYEQFWKVSAKITPSNAAKIHLASGYVLFRLHQDTAARQHFTQALTNIEQTSAQAGAERELFSKDEFRLIAYGFLAQLQGESIADRISHLKSRAEILTRLSKISEDWTEHNVQNLLQLALAEVSSSQSNAEKEMDKALQLAIEFGKNKSYLGPVAFQTACDAMLLAQVDQAMTKRLKIIKQLVNSILRSYLDVQANPTLTYQKLKLEILLASLQNESPQKPLASDAALKLKESDAALYQSLASLAGKLHAH